MNTEELTQVVTAHQSAISRHDIEIAETRQTLHRAGERLDSMTERLNALGDRLDTIGERLDRVTEQQEANARQGALNHESIQILAASMQELRNIVADHLRGRSN
ncbi:MAG: hypothetical protein NW224_15260 [Leptolyngbyaceae cyanobacterium bins.302]|nr:hypothetical protein [Leptolyngbyaceae cyanobacterium bins.302]